MFAALGRCESLQEQQQARLVALEEKLRQADAGALSGGKIATMPPQVQRLSPRSRARVPVARRLTSVTTIEDIAVSLDTIWLLVCGALVMFMQVGFAMVESGSCTELNAATILMKNVMDACLGAIVWWSVGYGFAYGTSVDSHNEFLGLASFAGATFEESNQYLSWFFQWAFCATAATIVSGAVAGRISFWSYTLFTVMMTGFIYPVIVFWTWHGDGYLTKLGYMDFAGSGIVHLTGGTAALVGAAIVGPRLGRFDPDKESEFAPHNMPMVVMGTFILWFGWYGFNCGSTLELHDAATASNAAMIATNSTLAAAAGGLMVLLLRLRSKKLDLAGMCNGILGGLVAICAGVNVLEPGVAVCTGLLAGAVQELAHLLLLKLKIDDPIDAFAVHGACGIVGVVTAPLFNRDGCDVEVWGANLAGMCAIIAWSGLLSMVVFLPLKFLGLLTLGAEEQEVGSDQVIMKDAAYSSPSKSSQASPGKETI